MSQSDRNDIPPVRVRTIPWPGTTTEDDLLALADGEPKCPFCSRSWIVTVK